MATTQNISMTDELAKFASDQVASGDFASVSEVYREALRGGRDRLETQKKYQELVFAKLETSKKAYERGEFVSLGDNEITGFMASISQEIDAEHA